MVYPYRQKIMELYRRPLNYGTVAKPTKKFKGANPFCGDALEIFVVLDQDQKIKTVKWQGQGCVISQVAASVLTEMIKGKTLAAAQKIESQVLIDHLDLELSPTRRKCALLPLYTIKEIQD
ncbi:MAG: iron-sulfur cluster assembly scaffold protein [Candidatus Buchananbacteria bacterium]|nr:iron-sulfur cluster assembly scaffold protein [Candidatus Buchananbacteria bacterium]